MAITTTRAKALSTPKAVDITAHDLALIRQLCMENKVIAQNTRTSEQVVKNRVNRLATKLGVENRTAIVIKALKLGLLALSELAYRERHA
jgi:DNA-binding NarL/FixJ family response regulator